MWVRGLLEERGVTVVAPDLPSHRSTDDGLLADVIAVRDAIVASPRPTVVVGWSYGCDVAGVAADGLEGVLRLVYVSSVPQPLHPEARDDSWLDSIPNLVWDAQGRFVLDDGWQEDNGRPRFAAAIQRHLDEHPRRPVPRTTMSDPVEAEAWRSIPTVALIGETDEMTSTEMRSWAREAIGEVRDIATDHFILFNRPEVVVDAVMGVPVANGE